ncbi:P-loop containing nucleoside triphosphate hydrolase protein [Daedalea quercina L-15889]|uniref:RNA helicase n=1 Tax=Daedalea quercina L-15889 TaxID=1314783 RepID=A0A165PPR9_9APHY|nr:P-loop containing nucleoside triphosphate hydrolase protein [Daedalea quercina L-15889]
MSLLSSSRVLVRRVSPLPPELVVACLHTTAPTAGPSQASRSRTRLARDLKPRSASGKGNLIVAPEVKIERDSAPHSAPGTRDHFKVREETLGRAREWRQRREKWREQHQTRDESRSKGKKAERPSTTGWTQSENSVRRARVAAEGVPDYDQPWRMQKERLRRPVKVLFGDTQGAEQPKKTDAPRKPQVQNPLSDEFDMLSRTPSTSELSTAFTSPPLMEGLLASVMDVLGPRARPTPIQALSLKHLFKRPLPGNTSASRGKDDVEYVQCLLASETGSGKSMAYLLPMLQDLKISELQSDPAALPPAQVPLVPRALVLAPTHELSRQLSGFAKALLHEIKLRVVCLSRANTQSTPARNASASKMAKDLDVDELNQQEGDAHRKTDRPLDVVVGTPSKVLELVKGRGWDREQQKIEVTWDKGASKPRKFTVGKPQMGLERIEWVVVDEADVLFDPDFHEQTNMILSAIAEARGQPPEQLDQATLSKVGPENPAPINYPFNLLLSTATIPSALAWHLDTYHPAFLRLASPHLHHLPKTLETEYVSWTGGNHNADVERQLRGIWHQDALREKGRLSKVLIFCNKSTKVEAIGHYLEEKGIANVALTSDSKTRRWGSNHHLDGFLKVGSESHDEGSSSSESANVPDAEPPSPVPAPTDVSKIPHVMITTSLLSRGLDFSADVKHVFIVDEPRNMIDFLHRAGRSGRAGEQGKVVVFGKTKGRGSDKSREVRQKVRALAA